MFELRWAQCRRVKPALWDYASERLSEEMMEQVERHLHGCATCDRELASLKRAQNLLAACRAQEEPAPRADWSDLRQRIVADGLAHIATPSLSRRVGRTAGRERMAAGSRAPWTMQLATAGVGGFAAVLALALGYGTLHSRNAEQNPRVAGNETLAVNAGPPALPAPSVRAEQVAASASSDSAVIANMIQALSRAHIQGDTVATENSNPAGVSPGLSAPALNVSARVNSSTLKRDTVRREHKPSSRMDYAAATMSPKMISVGLRTTGERASAHNSAAHKPLVAASHPPKLRSYNMKAGAQIASAPQAQAASRYALEHVQPVGSDNDESSGYVVSLVHPVSRDEDSVY